jgi:hypothetical protein
VIVACDRYNEIFLAPLHVDCIDENTMLAYVEDLIRSYPKYIISIIAKEVAFGT